MNKDATMVASLGKDNATVIPLATSEMVALCTLMAQLAYN